MEFIQLAVEVREKRGTSASRRLRATGRVPAVLYGLGRENRILSISNETFESFVKSGSRLVELRLGDKTQQAILRDVQHHPLTDEILHIDLLRIDKDHEIEAEVPVEFKGIPKGLSEGGVFEGVLTEIMVRCTPARLPEKLVLDVGHLALNEAITIKDLKLPEGVQVLHHKPDDHVAHCVPQKIVSLEPAPTAEGAAPAEPERIGGKKPEEEGAAEEGGKPAAGAPKAEAKKDKEEKKEKK
jgi:large subunit ribosomal protein L25